MWYRVFSLPSNFHQKRAKSYHMMPKSYHMICLCGMANSGHFFAVSPLLLIEIKSIVSNKKRHHAD